MKYSIGLIAILLIFYLWKFISAVIERGLPTHPLYYISAVIGVVIGFLTCRLTLANIAKRRYALIPLVIFIIAIIFDLIGVEMLRQIGSGLFFWYLISYAGFLGFAYIKKWRSCKQLTEAEETLEYTSKGLFFIVICFIIALLPVGILALLAFIFFR